MNVLQTSDLCSSPSRGSGESSRSSNQHKSRTDFTSVKEGDYAIPPDANQDIRATLINSTEPVGYLIPFYYLQTWFETKFLFFEFFWLNNCYFS